MVIVTSFNPNLKAEALSSVTSSSTTSPVALTISQFAVVSAKTMAIILGSVMCIDLMLISSPLITLIKSTFKERFLISANITPSNLSIPSTFTFSILKLKFGNVLIKPISNSPKSTLAFSMALVSSLTISIIFPLNIKGRAIIKRINTKKVKPKILRNFFMVL